MGRRVRRLIIGCANLEQKRQHTFFDELGLRLVTNWAGHTHGLNVRFARKKVSWGMYVELGHGGS